MRRIALLLPLLAACGKREPIAAGDLALELFVAAPEAEFGRAFPLTVRRVWNRDLVPSEWRERSLAPLVVRLLERSLRDDGERVEELLRYRAWAFRRGEVTVAPRITARPRDGGGERSAAAAPLRLRVRTSLPADDRGVPELPGGLLEERFPWAGSAAILLAAAAAALLLARRLRRRPPAPPPQATPEGPAERALARLRALAGIPAEDVAAAAAILRGFVAERLLLPAGTMTSGEILRAAEIPGSGRALLGTVLSAADLAKFAGLAPTPAERDRVLASAAGFVGEASGARGQGREAP